MEKENRFFLYFIVLIVCSLIGALVWVDTQSGRIKPVTSTLPSGDGAKLVTKLVEVPVLVDRTVVASDQTKHYSMEVHYPVLSLAENPGLAKDANSVISTYASDTIDGFKKDIDDMSSTLIPKEFTSDFNVRWSALLLSPTIISIRFDESEYIAGAAHPNTRTRILNYDLENHLLLSTQDLFASSSQALPFLSQYSRTALKTLLSDETPDTFSGQTLPGTEPTNDNFGVVGITKDGLLVVFDPYQVAPYARGTLQLPIASSDLVGVIAPRVSTAIRMATDNIVEATPENAATSSQNGSNQ